MAEKDQRQPQSRRKLIDGSFWFLLAIAVLSTGAALTIEGPEILPAAGGQFVDDLILIVPQILLGITVGALFTLLVPGAIVARHLGEQSGFRGVVLAAVFGTVMPGGPFTSFPIVYALGRSGAGIGSLISFLVAWAAVGLNRMIIWELPFMGLSFTMLHFFVSLPLPIIAGVLASKLSRRFVRLRMTFD